MWASWAFVEFKGGAEGAPQRALCEYGAYVRKLEWTRLWRRLGGKNNAACARSRAATAGI
jgi:hypothetical protein